MQAFKVTVATLSIFGFQKSSVRFTWEKFTNSNFSKGVWENTFVVPTIAIKKIFFLMIQTFEILFGCCGACPEERSGERVALLYCNIIHHSSFIIHYSLFIIHH